jgi:hypothetical protein
MKESGVQRIFVKKSYLMLKLVASLNCDLSNSRTFVVFDDIAVENGEVAVTKLVSIFIDDELALPVDFLIFSTSSKRLQVGKSRGALCSSLIRMCHLSYANEE